MPSSKTSSYVFPAIFLGIIFITFVLGTIMLGLRIYHGHKAAFEEAVAALPAFDQDAASKEAAAELGFGWPVESPKSSLESIAKRIDYAVSEAIEEAFSPKAVTKRTLEAISSCAQANPGDKIKFQLSGKNDLISGVFKRVEDGGAAGLFVVIDNGVSEVKYPRRAVMPEYLYLFSESDSKAMQEERLAAVKKQIEAEKESIAKSVRDSMTAKCYADAGYVKGKEGEWVSKADAVRDLAKLKKKKHEAKRDKEIEQLKKAHSLFGLFNLEVPKEDGSK